MVYIKQSIDVYDSYLQYIIGNKMTKQVWDHMVTKAADLVNKECKGDWSTLELVSGGAAWAGN